MNKQITLTIGPGQKKISEQLQKQCIEYDPDIITPIEKTEKVLSARFLSRCINDYEYRRKQQEILQRISVHIECYGGIKINAVSYNVNILKTNN